MNSARTCLVENGTGDNRVHAHTSTCLRPFLFSALYVVNDTPQRRDMLESCLCVLSDEILVASRARRIALRIHADVDELLPVNEDWHIETARFLSGMESVYSWSNAVSFEQKLVSIELVWIGPAV